MQFLKRCLAQCNGLSTSLDSINAISVPLSAFAEALTGTVELEIVAKLPQETKSYGRVVQGTTNSLTGYVGPCPTTLSADEWTELSASSFYKCPVQLTTTSTGVNVVVSNAELIDTVLNDSTVKDLFLSILHDSVCPDEDVDPAARFRDITMEGKDAQGNLVRLSTEQYVAAFEAAIALQPANEDFATDIVVVFAENVSAPIRRKLEEMKAGALKNTPPRGLQPLVQKSAFIKAKKEVKAADAAIAAKADQIKTAIRTTQAFHGATDVAVHSSSAERTLAEANKNMSDADIAKRDAEMAKIDPTNYGPYLCWSCDLRGHRVTKKGDNSIILCPRYNKQKHEEEVAKFVQGFVEEEAPGGEESTLGRQGSDGPPRRSL